MVHSTRLLHRRLADPCRAPTCLAASFGSWRMSFESLNPCVNPEISNIKTPTQVIVYLTHPHAHLLYGSHAQKPGKPAAPRGPKRLTEPKAFSWYFTSKSGVFGLDELAADRQQPTTNLQNSILRMGKSSTTTTTMMA